jgi:16S rRNA (guanine527-N7)-methyltransferase
LMRWNRRINLTALPLAEPLPASTLDKLIVEPLLAADLFPASNPNWFDLGSGGGSPAIPLRIACPAGSLTMVESRERKCAFLSEAVRTLGLSRTSAISTRFEELQPQRPIDVFTVRAVRIDAPLTDLLARWATPGAYAFCFGTEIQDERFPIEARRPLPGGSALFVHRRA